MAVNLSTGVLPLSTGDRAPRGDDAATAARAKAAEAEAIRQQEGTAASSEGDGHSLRGGNALGPWELLASH